MASTNGHALALTPTDVKRKDHRPIQLEWDMKVMTKVREGTRKWRSEPWPLDWDDEGFEDQQKKKIVTGVVDALSRSISAQGLWQALHEMYEEDYPRKNKGKRGRRCVTTRAIHHPPYSHQPEHRRRRRRRCQRASSAERAAASREPLPGRVQRDDVDGSQVGAEGGRAGVCV